MPNLFTDFEKVVVIFFSFQLFLTPREVSAKYFEIALENRLKYTKNKKDEIPYANIISSFIGVVIFFFLTLNEVFDKYFKNGARNYGSYNFFTLVILNFPREVTLLESCLKYAKN